MGGHLVSNTSREEEMFVLSLMNEYEFAWTALTDSEIVGASEGNNKWFTGESYTYEPPAIQHAGGEEDFYVIYKSVFCLKHI